MDIIVEGTISPDDIRTTANDEVDDDVERAELLEVAARFESYLKHVESVIWTDPWGATWEVTR